MVSANHEFDVVVIGGGPAGSTVSTLLALQGFRVGLYEREKFPRFHIGESLIPETYWPLARTGMLEKMKDSTFVHKHSVQFITQTGKISEPFYFHDNKPHESSQTWQVERAQFDLMMLRNAEEKGVKVHEGVRVSDVLFEGTRAVGIRVGFSETETRDIRAKVVVDASGQQSMLIGKLNLREWDPQLRKAALWTYFKGASRDSGRDSGATHVLQIEGKKGWFWYIPQQNDITSIGVVADHDYLFRNRGTTDFEEIYNQEVAKCPGLGPKLAQATRCDQFRAQKEYSYRAKQVAGDGWTLVGDAYGFLDPLYSSGVLLALASGSRAADTIAEALRAGDTSETRLRSWEKDFNTGMDRMRRLVCEFYDGFSFGRFVKKHPHLKGMLTDMLIGDIFREDLDILWPLIDEVRAEQAAAIAAN